MKGTDPGCTASARRARGVAQSMTLLLVLTVLLMGLIVAWPTVRDAVISELVDTAGSVDEISQSYSFSGLEGSLAPGSDWLDGVDAGQTADPAGGFGRGVSLVEAAGEEAPDPPTSDPESCADIDFPMGLASGFNFCCAVDSSSSSFAPGCAAGDLAPGFDMFTFSQAFCEFQESVLRPSMNTTFMSNSNGPCICDPGQAWFLFPGEPCPVA